MKRILIPVLSLLAVLVFHACEGLSPEGTGSELSVTPAAPVIPASGDGIWVSVKASGAWTLSLDFGEEPETPWARLSKTEGSGDAGNVRLTCDANTSEESRSVILVLLSGTKVAQARVEQKGSSASGGGGIGQYGYDTAPDGLDWLELPATVAGDGRELLIHSMAGGKYANKYLDGVRNWTAYYDVSAVTSVWVAYPLNMSLVGSGERTDQWGMDPLVAQKDQQWNTSWVSGGRYYSDKVYDRWHQIPSADRYNYSANVTTFYGTNMTPQNGPFNSGIWAKLENKVRDYSRSSDTLYVVTGCLIDDSKVFVTDRDADSYHDIYPHNVPVPTHYFKALLYRGSSSYTTKGFMAAGFLLPHDSSISSGNFLNYIMSIDELEQKTGIDFFPNLEYVVGAETASKIEETAPASWWK